MMILHFFSADVIERISCAFFFPNIETVLSRVLEEHGYLTLELYLHKYVRLDTVLQERIPDYATLIE